MSIISNNSRSNCQFAIFDSKDFKGHEKEFNTSTCKTWYIIDSVAANIATIDWYKYELSEKNILLLKQFLRALTESHGRDEGAIYARISTVKGSIGRLSRYLSAFEEIYGRNALLSDLDLGGVQSILIEIVTGSFCSAEIGVKAGNTMGLYISIVRQLVQFYAEGKIFDGLDVTIPKKALSYFLEQHITTLGLDYQEWERAGTLDRLPLDVGLLFINDMIDIIEHKQTEFCVKYFDIQRSEYRVHPDKLYRDCTVTKLALRAACQMLLDGHSDDEVKRCINEQDYFRVPIKHQEKNRLSSNEKKGVYLIAKLYEEYGYLDKPTNINHWCDKVIRAAIVVSLGITGIRRSESTSIRHKDLVKKHGNCYFYSTVLKTHSGLRVKRSISQFGYDLIDKVSRLSFLPLDADVSTFSSKKYWKVNFDLKITDSNRNDFMITGSTLAHKVRKAYRDWTKERGDLFDSLPTTATPHGLRHIFAAVAVRGFSGKVRDLTARHFLHSVTRNTNHQFTDAYVRSKLHNDIISLSEDEYFNSLLRDFVDDEKEIIQIAKRIKARVDENHIFGTPDEVADMILGVVEEVGTISGHEYGFYIHDDSNFDPDELGHSVHHLNKHSKTEGIIRTGISHQNVLDQFPKIATYEQSEAVVAMCESMLNELGYTAEKLTDEPV